MKVDKILQKYNMTISNNKSEAMPMERKYMRRTTNYLLLIKKLQVTG
jgi:hypothetical protein